MSELFSFGAWVRQRRRALDLTREELAALIGCAVTTIRHIETDERRPSKQLAARLQLHFLGRVSLRECSGVASRCSCAQSAA